MPMQFPDGFRVFAYAAIVCIAALAFLHLRLFDASEDAVSRSMRYDTSWIGMNGRIEVLQLEKFVARFDALGRQTDAAQARLFYDIVLSRLDAWASGSFKAFLELDPRWVARFEQLMEMIAGLAPDFTDLDNNLARKRVMAVLAQAGPIAQRIGADAHSVAIREAVAIRDELRERQFHQRLLIFVLLSIAAILLGLMAFQNRRLQRATQSAKKNAEAYAFLARHDALTELPNRLAFDSAFRSALKDVNAERKVAVVALDLDSFKSVNDMLGHGAGDALLVAVGRVLQDWAQALHTRNVVSRVGGDEFLVMLLLDDHVETVGVNVEALLSRFKEPLETQFGAMMVGLSAGFAVSGQQRQASDVELILNADLALTEAKARGKGAALEYDPVMRAELQRRLQIEADLEGGISDGQIVPHYQLQFDLTTGDVIGAEALARWHHPELGWISPAEFIPIAESCGDVTRVGRAILEMACRDAAMLPEHLGISVNLSVMQLLREDIVATVSEILEQSGLSPARLTLEVTESVMITDATQVLSQLEQLKQLGVSIALDDFGTGYSALSYLTVFNWDELKIDRSFVDSALHNPVNLAVIRGVVMLAKHVGARVIAEGVETEEQRELLARIGCHFGQGFLLGRPQPASELASSLLGHFANSLPQECGNDHPVAAAALRR